MAGAGAWRWLAYGCCPASSPLLLFKKADSWVVVQLVSLSASSCSDKRQMCWRCRWARDKSLCQPVVVLRQARCF